MQLNGIDLAGYSAEANKATFVLEGVTMQDALNLDGQTLTVTQDGTDYAVYAGYSVIEVREQADGSISMTAMRKLSDQTAEAINGLDASVTLLTSKLGAVETSASDAAAKADEAKTAADEASTAAQEAKDTAAQAGTDPSVMAFARMAVLPMAADMTISEGASVAKLWPERKVGDTVKLKDFFWYGGELYRCNQPELTITAGQEPDKNLPALYTHVSVADDGILIWDADDLTGAPDIYNTGVKVHYPDADGPVYESRRDGNTSTPGADEWWTLVEG